MKKLRLIDKSLLYIDTEKGRLSLFGLAFPLFIESITVHLIAMLQSVLSARYEGGFFVTPFSVANQIMGMAYTIITLVPIGVAIILSINLGRQRYDDCKTIIGTGIIASFALCLVMVVICFFLRTPLLRLMGLGGEEYVSCISHAERYLGIRIWGYLFTIVQNVLNTALRCYGYTRIGIYSGLIANSINVGVTALAMYGLHLPFDNAATVLALIGIGVSAISCVISLIYFIIKRIQLNFRFSFAWLRRTIGVGLPGSMSAIFYTLSTMITSMICLSLTQAAYLAKVYVTNVEFFIHQVGYAIGQAGSIITGRMCGMKQFDKLDKMHRQNLRLVIVINFTAALLFAIFSRQLISLLYGASKQILTYSLIVFFINVFVEVGRGMNHIGEKGLNATGDVRFTTIVSILSCWVCSVGLSALFVYVFKWDLYGIWIAFAIDEIFRGMLYYVRWRRGKWRKSFEREEKMLETMQSVNYGKGIYAAPDNETLDELEADVAGVIEKVEQPPQNR